MAKQKIIPHLWFDKEAIEAAQLYTSMFKKSKITYRSTLHNTPSGDTNIVGFTISDFDFMAISAGPLFKINPAISFHVKCKTVKEVDNVWRKLSEGGTVLMKLDTYPFSKRYGWIQDKYGVSWQVILADDHFKQRIIPILMFTQNVSGKAEEAAGFYSSVFSKSTLKILARYKNEAPDKDGSIKYARLILKGQEFGIMDSAQPHQFTFNEGVSLIINCKDQKEIDYYWDKLSAVPEAERCGWLKDKYGVSWQIVPTVMNTMMSKGTTEQINRVTQTFLPMKKLIIADLEQAYRGEANKEEGKL